MLSSAKATASSLAKEMPSAASASWKPMIPSPTGRCRVLARSASGVG